MSESGEAAPGRQAKRGHGVDLKSIGPADLRQLIGDAEAELRNRQDAIKADFRAKWEKEAAEAGLTVDAVLPTPGAARAGQGDRKAARKGTGGTLPVKFRGPNGEAWSGRGRLPKWLQVAEAGGKKREDYAV